MSDSTNHRWLTLGRLRFCLRCPTAQRLDPDDLWRPVSPMVCVRTLNTHVREAV